MQAMRTQLVAARAVAGVEVDRALDPAEPGATVEVAGPREERLLDAARLLAARRGTPRRVEEGADAADPDAGRYLDGSLLPGPAAVLAGPTFEAWLDAVSPRSRRAG